MNKSVFASAVVVCALGLACDKTDRGSASGSATTGSPNEPKSVLCLNAASTKDVLAELAISFAKTTGIAVKFSPEDSAKLANQIAQGAPADVFLSANEKWADFVGEKGFASATKPLLGNTLVMIAPKASAAKVTKPDDLRGAAIKRVAVAGPNVPAGIYAKASLTSLKLWDELDKAKKISPGENVRSTLTFVERGEADAGIVYATDAKVSDKVEVVYTFDPSTYPKIVYPLVLLKRGEKNESAKKWFDYLQSSEAANAFRKAGFTSLVGT
jgi:molybdate transport system substrate-binding protein